MENKESKDKEQQERKKRIRGLFKELEKLDPTTYQKDFFQSILKYFKWKKDLTDAQLNVLEESVKDARK